MSALLSVPIASLPDQAFAPTMLAHSKDSISVGWQVVADKEGVTGRVRGYRLYMDNGLREDFEVVMNGETSPDIISHTVTGLSEGRPYRFYVEALNFVGVGP
jgi:hypothetical protein